MLSYSGTNRESKRRILQSGWQGIHQRDPRANPYSDEYLKIFSLVEACLLCIKSLNIHLNSDEYPSIPDDLVTNCRSILTSGHVADHEADCTLRKFADDTKLEGVPDTPQGFDVIQRDLNRLEKWADRYLAKFNKEKCKVLHLGRYNPMHQYMLGTTQQESSFAENALRFLMDTKLNRNQQYALVAEKANSFLTCIRRSVPSRLREVIASLCLALVRPHVQY
ncbi:rna-directed dna polymerase from mobile element jockey-like [Limosa lapponica baueri]|uniref:Rna-directed dna polymerase from mobile element jockey-like n=1 Tax=Limosa lapponica baueri TaxID=1758121 RepID=A0A2I0U1Q0_LIMLA|nr:rna-directed dna polymerase from mobile element jockey-like [Limosa lapponica baueri]